MEFFVLSNFKKSVGRDQSVIVRGKLDSPNVIENFAKLRLVMNTQDRASGMQEQAQSFDIIDYIIAKPLNDSVLLEEFARMQSRHYKQEGQISAADPKRTDSALREHIHRMLFDDAADERHIELERHLLDSHSYLYILVMITLDFIRVEDEQQGEGTWLISGRSKTTTVNASACEFMDLLLKSVSQYPQISNKIAHLIIEPLTATLHHTIERNNHAMQVNMINLLDLVLNHCYIQGDFKSSGPEEQPIALDSNQLCLSIFAGKELIDSILLGLNCDVGFVRSKYIKFIEMYVPYLRDFARRHESYRETFKTQMQNLLQCMCDLLKRVDVTSYSKASRKYDGAASKDLIREYTVENKSKFISQE
jgi:hypothetical protein